MITSSIENKNPRTYARDKDNLMMINSQVFGFSMRRKVNSSSIKAGTKAGSFTQYNDLQSSRCQSNISLDSLLTQYIPNSLMNKSTITKKASKKQGSFLTVCNKVQHLYGEIN